MENIDLDSFVTLVLLKRETFRDSYNLTKALAWKFDIISFLEIKKELKKKKFITEENIKGINWYKLTNAGLVYIEMYKEQGKSLLLEKYKEEQEFIEHIFSRW